MRYGLGAAYLRQQPPQYGRWSPDGAAMTGPVAGCSVCAIVALCATVAVAVPLVLPFGAYPVIARTTSTVCDRRDGITVCVWPVSWLPTCPGNLVEMDM